MYYGGGLQKCLGLLITCLVAWEIGISAIQSKLWHIDFMPHIWPVFLLHLKRYHNGMCVYIIEKFTKKRQKQVTSFSKVYLKRANPFLSHKWWNPATHFSLLWFFQDAFAGCSVNTCNLGSNIYTKRVRPARIDFIFYSSDTCPTSQMEVQV